MICSVGKIGAAFDRIGFGIGLGLSTGGLHGGFKSQDEEGRTKMACIVGPTDAGMSKFDKGNQTKVNLVWTQRIESENLVRQR